MTEDKKIFNFQKLTPIHDTNLSIYQNALNFIFEHPELKNIGITGAYGAGKSSVIETYKAQKPDLSFMHISLAYFEPTEGEIRPPEKQGESVLEWKILNQLVQQIDPTAIPQTNFRIKRELSKKKIWWSTTMVLLLVVFSLFFFHRDGWINFVNSVSSVALKTLLISTTTPLAAILAGLIALGILYYFIYAGFQLQWNKNFLKGISVKGNTIEMFQQDDESYFDKYLNEVVYLFEHAKKDVIVFEDIDRYNSNQIFQRLREINTLVNSRRKQTDKPLRFFYLLRDDIFINKERTKFFDFLMPVVPVVDSSNSYDQFIAHFKDGNIYQLFNEHFLQEVSLYIDDMRILKNIYNEFLIYHEQISTTEQDPNKLLAMIIYKNVFPRDFSQLQLNRGYVHALFDQKEKFIENERQRLRAQIVQINDALTAAENEHLRDVREVNQIYDPQIREQQRYYSHQNEVEALEKDRDARLDHLKNREIKQKETLKKKIQKLENEIADLQHSKLHELIAKHKSLEIFKVTSVNEIGKELNFNEIKGSDYFLLIKYLIRYGYIDESYPDYMTYFYENSLSRTDKIFLRSVTDEDAKECDYPLKSPETVAARLNPEHFDKEETLNFDLLAFLLAHRDDDIQKDKLTRLLQQLKEQRNFQFIDLYIQSGKATAAFVSELNTLWPAVFQSIVMESDLTEGRKKRYALETLCHTADETLKQVDLEGVLSKFVSACPNFLEIEYPDIHRLTDAFELLHIKFQSINYAVSNKALFQVVYEHNLYAVHFELICLMLKTMYGCGEEVDWTHKNYSTVLSQLDQPLVKYVHENMDEYVGEVLEHCDGEITDTEVAAIRLLNTETLSLALKENYIDKLTTPIHRLAEITQTALWSELLGCELVVYSEENILQYFFRSKNGIDCLLANLIDQRSTSTLFDYASIDKAYGEDSGSKFFNAVVKSEFLSVASYAKILKSLNRVYRTFSIEGISNSKIDVLIAQGRIPMNEETLVFMREHYADKVIPYISRNIQTYTQQVLTEDLFVLEEMLGVLATDVADPYKLALLKHTEAPLRALQDTYSDEVKIYILTNNFDNSELPALLKKHSEISAKLQSVVENIAQENVTTLIEEMPFVPFSLCCKLFTRKSILPDEKLQLFATAIEHFNESECKQSLTLLNRNDILGVFSGKRPAIAITEVHEKILDVMVNKRWISGYHVDKKDETMYRVSSRRTFKQQALPTELL